MNPLILSQENLVGWYTGVAPQRLATFRLQPKLRVMRHCYKSVISLKISEYETTPYPLDDDTKRNLRKNLQPTFSALEAVDVRH